MVLNFNIVVYFKVKCSVLPTEIHNKNIVKNNYLHILISHISKHYTEIDPVLTQSDTESCGLHDVFLLSV